MTRLKNLLMIVYLFFLISCSNVRVLQFEDIDSGNFNRKLSYRNAKLVFKDDSMVNALNIQVAEDSISWMNRTIEDTIKIDIDEVNMIIINNWFSGAWKGFLLGVGTGAAIGILSTPDTKSGYEGMIAALSAVTFGAIGGSFGALIGSMTLSAEQYMINKYNLSELNETTLLNIQMRDRLLENCNIKYKDSEYFYINSTDENRKISIENILSIEHDDKDVKEIYLNRYYKNIDMTSFK